MYFNKQTARTRSLIPWLLYALYLFSSPLVASENIATPPDTNSWATVENAIVEGDEATLFFFTRPDIRDPEARNPCALNYYSVKLKPGLPATKPVSIARGVCGGVFQKSRLLDNGDALVIVRDRLERWRGGEMISSETFSSIGAVSKLGVSTDMTGGQFYDIAPNGNLVLVVQSGDHTQDADEYGGIPLIMTSIKADGEGLWEMRFTDHGIGHTVKQVWAGRDGSALLHTTFLESGLTPSEETRLYFVSAAGSKTTLVLNESGEAMDIESMSDMSLQDAQAYLQQQKQQSVAEEIRRLGAVARSDGGFDVLFQRRGGGVEREGFFLYRIDPEGNLQSEISLGTHIEEHGLERWFDFYVEGDKLLLLSSAAVTQKVVRKVKKKWMQNIVSWIDLDSGIPSPRLLPLDQRYLEAAMNAGDEGQQYLEGQPGSEPVLLTKLGGKPLVVSTGWISKRQVIRLHEADETLLAFTEVVDERQASLAKEASRKQRRADRDAQSQRMHADMAAAAGMSVEDFSALSNREQKKALISSGNFDQMKESMMREAKVAQAQQGISSQNTPQQQAQGMNAQIAAAASQLEQELANSPHLTPEMRAQMAAIMSQMGQAGGMPGVPQQALAQTGAGKPVTPAANTLKVDSGQRGFIEFENPDGRKMTLLIFNRQNGDELLKKDYPSGVIYEYVDFSRFNLPLDQIGVIYREVSGLILKDLSPAIEP